MVNEIFALGNTADIINALKEKSVPVPSWSTLVGDYEPSKHKIVNDKIGRKDKEHRNKDGEITRFEAASRIYIGLEKLHTKRMTEFMFSIPPKRIYHNTEGNEKRHQIANALELIYKHARIDTENIKRGIAYFASCEVLTIWYAVEKKNTLYGFPSNYKLKCKTYSQMDGVRLYPLFDEYGEMHAMSLEYEKTVGEDKVTYFETYTADRHYKWKFGKGWETVMDKEGIKLAKIPAIYLYRNKPIYDGLSYIREEIEYTLSRNSDVVAYNSAPVLKVVGEMRGSEEKGESRRVYRVENGGDVAYVSWSQSIEALKYHVEQLINLYWMQAQMPDISFENMKNLGNIGFDARQTLLTDAHLKVGEESGAWIEFFERETNVVKAFLGEMNTSFKSELDNVEVEHIITPFIQNDKGLEADRLLKLNGGKAVISHIESIKQAGYSSDPETTLKQIQEEEATSVAGRMEGLFAE